MTKENYEISILFNNSSGSGKAQQLASETAAALMRNGLDCNLHSFAEARKEPDLMRFRKCDAGIIIAGDGTIFDRINQTVNNGSDRKPPIVIIPTGTENRLASALKNPKVNKNPIKDKEPVISKLEEILWPDKGLVGKSLTPGSYNLEDINEQGLVWWLLSTGNGITMQMLKAIEDERYNTSFVKARLLKAGLKTIRRIIRGNNSVKVTHYNENDALIDSFSALESTFVTGFPGYWSRVNVANGDSEIDYIFSIGRDSDNYPRLAARRTLQGIASAVYMRKPIPIHSNASEDDFLTKTYIRPGEKVVFEPNHHPNHHLILDSEIVQRDLTWNHVSVHPRVENPAISVYTSN